MDREEKLQHLEALKQLRKQLDSPDYSISKQISELKKELGIAPVVNVKKKTTVESSEPPAYPEMVGVRIAVDVAVGTTAILFLRKRGIKVVVCAEEAEPDESWISRALEAKVEVIVSDDREVQMTAKLEGLLCVDSEGKDREGHHLYRSLVNAVLGD